MYVMHIKFTVFIDLALVNVTQDDVVASDNDVFEWRWSFEWWWCLSNDDVLIDNDIYNDDEILRQTD